MRKIMKNLLMGMVAAASLMLLVLDLAQGGAREIVPADYITGSGLSRAAPKRRTIMIYMNGSDLESEHASASVDLREMLDSGFDGQNINLIIFAGGSRRWHTPGIRDGHNTLLKIEGGELVRLAQAGRDPMGYPETLAGFINFCLRLYPAEEYGLILWNHGGGAILGYGDDERFRSKSQAKLKLSEIEAALQACDMPQKFEFIGFDTCLMATLEMALVAERYAHFLIASEELEPEPGWDYSFLGAIRPDDAGARIGEYIIDAFARYYSDPRNSGYDDITTLSLTDLSRIKQAGQSFERLAAAAGDMLGGGQYRRVAGARSGTRMFGGRGYNSCETDMIDLRGLAINLRGDLPEQAEAFERDLGEAVIYKFERNISGLGGLSIYFPFANRADLGHNLAVYRSIGRLPEYTGFLTDFADLLESRPDIKSAPPVKSARLNGLPVQLYEMDSETRYKRYAVPVDLNGEKACLIAVYSSRCPAGRITGAVKLGEDGILDKKIVPVRPGDKICVHYCGGACGQFTAGGGGLILTGG